MNTDIQNEKNHHSHFLENVNVDLKEVIEEATVDFMAVNSVLKKYYDNRQMSAKSNTGLYQYEDGRIELMVASLQYMDIFRQRVEHLIIIHQELMNDAPDLSFKESFFHLHIFQSLTIELDLFQSVITINSLLRELRPHFTEVGKIEWKEETFFNNAGKIKETLTHTISQLRIAGGDTMRLPIPTLTVDQVGKLNSVYTMGSERLVLAWFLNSMPRGTWADLLQYYHLAINELDAENTELF